MLRGSIIFSETKKKKTRFTLILFLSLSLSLSLSSRARPFSSRRQQRAPSRLDMRRLLSKAVGRGGGGGGEDAKAQSNAALAGGGGKLTTKHQRQRARGSLCITAQPESSPSPEQQPKKPASAVFLEATSQFVGLSFDPFRSGRREGEEGGKKR